ncbi:SAM-dependent methyltransferase [Streptomyces odontomachi]|uniref:SAM-dependent methyltransferase n=1 Tax=Streptomyces odontomachi TaxID=2944940 RepID=UPI00210B08D4|nr:SAM-dependent methyltransferase [Streptomyces sp. ODS25]
MTTQGPRPAIDSTRPHPARVYDYLLGGKDHYLVDEEVARRMPQEAQAAARQNRAFMRRAMAFVAGYGVDQFLDIGTGIPTEPNLHQVVQGIAPASRVVYVDNDPIVLRHAEALLVSTEQGATDYIEADVRKPQVILGRARELLDFARPVCVSLVALMHFIRDEEDPYGIVRGFVDALPSGSWLVLTHGTFDFVPVHALDPGHEPRRMAPYTDHITATARSRDAVLRFFDGLELVEPGLVAAVQWRNDDAAPPQPSGMFAGVARVP